MIHGSESDAEARGEKSGDKLRVRPWYGTQETVIATLPTPHPPPHMQC